MKTTKLVLLTLALGASTCLLMAQDSPQPPPGQGPGGPGGPGGMRPRLVLPIVQALDLNNDGIIDADEIAKASESLKKLDKNGDGKLTPDEYLPARPSGFGGPGGPPGFGGPGGGRGRPEGGPGGDAPQRPPPEK